MGPHETNNSNETKPDPSQINEVKTKGQSKEKLNSNKLTDIMKRMTIALKFKLCLGQKKNKPDDNTDSIKSKTVVVRPLGPRGRRLPTPAVSEDSKIIMKFDSTSTEARTTDTMKKPMPLKVAKKPPGKSSLITQITVEETKPLSEDEQNKSTPTAESTDKSPLIPNKKATDTPKEETTESTPLVDDTINKDTVELTKSPESSRFDTSLESESNCNLKESRSSISLDTSKSDVEKMDSTEDTKSVEASAQNDKIGCNQIKEEQISNEHSQESKKDASNSTTGDNETSIDDPQKSTVPTISDPILDESTLNPEKKIFFDSSGSRSSSLTPTDSGISFSVQVNSKRSPHVKAVSMQTNYASLMYKNVNKKIEPTSHTRNSKSSNESHDSKSEKEPTSINSTDTESFDLNNTKIGNGVYHGKTFSLPFETMNIEQISDPADASDPDNIMKDAN